MKEEIARLLSSLSVYVLFAVAIVVIGYSIKDVEATLYPEILTVFIIYIGVGDLVFIAKRADAPASRRIEAGGVDLVWGIKHYYWVLWWPRILRTR